MSASDPGMIAIGAIKRPASERPAFLQHACGGDAQLRAKVERLIKAYEESGRFSAESQPDTQAPTPRERPEPVEGPGTRIGRYKLLQQIGEGGFGVVYMAEQHEPVRRKVALKVVKPGMDTKEVIARFEAERQALALMDHPNIARVLDAGTTDGGRPYFVMELVRGVSITEYCDKNNLATRERLELFATVCHAVQHAHQKGIIHRDLKPSNILVTLHDGKPVAKVIDFGVAKALHQQLTERTLFTAYGQVVGTPQYMSPEQAEMSGLDIDTRSDIYSLGVLLYELLTGSTPFDAERLRSAGFAEMLRIIREEEPPKPSTRLSTAGEEATVVARHRSADPRKLCQQLRGELDWIVMKALDKDRNRRYANANGLAADLRRYLDDEPVSACPPSAAYRVRKFTRRNKKLVAAAGAIGAVLLCGAVLSAVMAVRAWDAARVAATRLAGETEARAEAERARQAESDQRAAAESERDRALEAEREATRQKNLAVASERKAEANFQHARDTVDRYLTTVSESQLLTVPGMQPLRQKLLDSSLTFYERFVAERRDNIQLRAGLAAAYLRLGEVYGDLREKEKAKIYYTKSREAFEALVRAGHAAPDTLRRLGKVYSLQGRHAETVALCKRVLQDQPDNRAAQQLLASTYNSMAVGAKNRSNTQLTQVQLTRVLRIHRDALAIRQRLVELDPDNPEYLGDLSSTINNIGVVLGNQKDTVQALAMFRLARQYGDAAFARAPYSMLYGRFAAILRENVAINAARMGLQEEALEAYRAVVDAWNLLAVNNPAIASYKIERYKAYQQLAGYQQQIGRQDQAAATFRLARASVENLPQETANDVYDLAKVYAALARSRGPEQEAMGKRAVHALARAAVMGYGDLSVMEKEPALDKIRKREDFQRLLAVLKLEQEIGKVYEDPEKREEVEKLRKELEQYGQDELARIPIARALRKMAEFYEGAKEFDEARPLLDQASSLLEGNAEDPHVALDLLATKYSLGHLYWEDDRHSEAHDLWQRVLAELENLSAGNRDNTKIMQSVARIERQICDGYGRLGLWQYASEYIERNLQRERTWDGFWDTRFGHVLAALGRGDEHDRLCQLLFEKWGKSRPQDVLWATAMNPRSKLDSVVLLELAERVIQPRKDGPANFCAATAYYRAGQYETALQLMVEGRPRDFVVPAYRYWYAMVDHKRGAKEDAARMFEQAEAAYLDFAQKILQSPAASAVQDGHGGYWYTWAEDQAMRRRAWNEIRGQDPPTDPWHHLIQSRGYRLIGEVEKAEAELAAAVAAAPENLEVRLARARLFEELGRYEESIADASRAAELDSHNADPWIVRGQCHAALGEQEKADADFAKAASRFENLSEKDQLQIADRLLECGQAVVLDLPDRHDAPYRTLITRDDLARGLPDASRTKDAQQTFYQTLAVRQFTAQPNIVDPAWQLTRIVFLRGCQAAHYNPRDGKLYVGTRDTGSDGLYAIDADGRIARIADADRVAAVAVDPELGHIFVSEDFGGEIYRTAFRSTGREIWVSGFKPTDSDPVGMAFATKDYTGDLLAPSEGLVVDRGWWHAPDEIYRFSVGTREQKVLLHSDGESEGPLLDPLDVTIGASGIFIVDAREQEPGCIFRLGDDGSLTLVPTNMPIDQPMGIASDPITGDLFVADRGGKQLLRVNSKSGATSQILTGLSLGGVSFACVDVTPDGRQVFVTDHDSNTILTFTVRNAQDYAEAIEKNPEDPAPWIERARWHAFHGDREQALADLNKSAELEPADAGSNDPVPWIQRGRFYAELGQREKADADFAKAASLTPSELNKFLQAGWWVVGPYPPNLDEFCPPEIDPDPSKPVYVIDPKTGLSDEPVGWCSLATRESHPGAQDSYVGLTPYAAHKSDSSSYAFTYVFASQERSVTLLTGDKPCRVWVNGIPAQEATAGRVRWRHEKRVPIALRAGRNTILIKTKSNGFVAFLSDAPSARAWELLKFGDFPQAVEVYSEVLQRPTEQWIARMACFAALVTGDRQHYREFAKHLPTQSNRAPKAVKGMLDAEVYCSVPVAESDLARLKEILERWYAAPDRPQAVPFQRMAASAHYRLGEFDQVLKILDKFNAPAGWPLLAMTYHRLNQPEQARHCLQRARTQIESWLKLSGAEAAEGLWVTYPMYREACELILGDSVDVDGPFDEFLKQRRRLWEARDPLIRAFDEAISNAPRDCHAWLARGKRLADLGRWDQAEADFNKAVELAPDNPEVLAARAEFHAEMGDVEKTVADFNAALDAIPAQNRYSQSSWVYLAATRDDNIFNRLSAIRNDEYVPFYKMLHYLHQHEISKANSIVVAWLGAKGNHSPADQCGWTAGLVLCGDLEEFERRREKIQTIQFKKNSGHHSEYVKAMTLGLAPTSEEMAVELLETAKRLLVKAPKLKKRFAITLGLAQLRAGMLDEAVQTLESGVDLTPGQKSPLSEVWPLLAIAHHLRGDSAEASTYLKKTERLLELHQSAYESGNYATFEIPRGHTRFWLFSTVFYREAKRLIDGAEALAAEEKRLADQRAQRKLDLAQRAEANFQRMVDQAGDDPMPWVQRSCWHAQRAENDKAEADWRRAVELAGTDPMIWIHRARWHAFRGEHEKAMADYTKAIELDPDNAQLYVTRGGAYLAQERSEQAQADFDKAQELAPNDWKVWRARGDVHDKLDQWDQAIADYGKAIELAPHEWPLWKARAERFAKSKQWDKAIALYTKIVEHNSDNEELWQSLTEAYFQLKQPQKALEVCDQVIQLRPDDSWAWRERARACFKLKRWDQTIENSDRAIKLKPDDAHAYVLRSAAYREKGDYAKAVDDCTSALRIDPKLLTAFHHRAIVHRLSGRYDEALKDTRTGLRIAPDNAALLQERALNYDRLKQWDQAIADYSEAIQRAPENPALYRDRGNVHQQLKEWDKAIEDYRQAMKIKPRYSWCWLRLLDIQFARGASPETTQAIVAEAEAAMGRPAVLELVFQHAAWNLLLNRRAEYEKICRQSAERFADSTNSMELLLLARTAALTNKPVLETEQLVEMARQGVEAKPAPWKEQVLGLCLLRDGQLEAAIKRFNQTAAQKWPGKPLSWLGLAIAHAAAGRDRDARDWLGKAQAWFKQNPLDATSELPPSGRIECQLLLREAKQLIQRKSSTGENEIKKTP